MGFFKRSIKEEPEKELSAMQEEMKDKGAVVVAKRTPDCEHPIIEREILPDKIICPYCHEITIDGVEFCTHCGRKLL